MFRDPAKKLLNPLTIFFRRSIREDRIHYHDMTIHSQHQTGSSLVCSAAIQILKMVLGLDGLNKLPNENWCCLKLPEKMRSNPEADTQRSKNTQHPCRGPTNSFQRFVHTRLGIQRSGSGAAAH